MWLLLACRPDPGAPDYPEPSALGRDSDSDFLSGTTPYEEGDTRLSIGIFYEGGASQWIDVDNVSQHFYIYEASFTVATSDERVEGYTSDEIVVARDTWWGGGVHWDDPRDLSAYTTMHVALMSEDNAALEIAMQAGGDEGKLAASDYGFVADGAWHDVVIPLEDFGLSLSAVDVPLVLVGEAWDSGSSFHIDDLYLDDR